MSNHIVKFNQYFVLLIWIAFFNIFVNIIYIIRVFEYSIKTLEPLWYFRPTPSRFASCGSSHKKLSLSGWWLVSLTNAFVFQDPESPIINILYEWTGICGQFQWYSFMFYLVITSKLIIFVLVYYIVTFSFFFFTY